MDTEKTNEKCETEPLDKLNKNNDSNSDIIKIKNKQKKWIQYSMSKENINDMDKEECLKCLKNYQNERYDLEYNKIFK